MDKVRIGVVGVGGMGGNHAQRFLAGEIKGAELVAVCDIRPEAMEKFDNLQKFADSAELIRSGAVDAIIVATPHYDHTTIGADGLQQGLHVLVEKPISVHKADCERLIAARSSKDQVFSAMFNQRTSPQYRKVKQLLADGELGDFIRMNWIITSWFRTQAYYDRGGWRATWGGEGGGVLLNQCPHQLDLLQWICGMPSKVRAFCQLGLWHNIEVEDQVTAYLEYPNGGSGVFVTSTGEAPGTNRLEIVGTRGRLVADGGKISFARNTVPCDEFLRESKESFATPEVWNIDVPPAKGGGGQHREILQNFTDAILKGTPLIAPAEEGINSVELGNAMLMSSMLEKPVDVPLDSAAFEAMLKDLIAKSTFKKTVVEREEGDMGASFVTS